MRTEGPDRDDVRQVFAGVDRQLKLLFILIAVRRVPAAFVNNAQLILHPPIVNVVFLRVSISVFTRNMITELIVIGGSYLPFFIPLSVAVWEVSSLPGTSFSAALPPLQAAKVPKDRPEPAIE